MRWLLILVLVLIPCKSFSEEKKEVKYEIKCYNSEILLKKLSELNMQPVIVGNSYEDAPIVFWVNLKTGGYIVVRIIKENDAGCIYGRGDSVIINFPGVGYTI